MKLIVNKQNLNTIKGLIEKIGKGKSLKDQLFYPTSKKRSVIKNNIGIESDGILKSKISTFDVFKVDAEPDFITGRSFIRVHNNDHSINDYGYENYMAFILHCGDSIEFKNNSIIKHAQK